MGGIVPYGYRKQGEKGQRRLIISEEPIPGFKLSEADVVKTIFRMSGVEKKSCQKIADHLHLAGIPPVSSEGFARSEEGKRKRRNAPIWRPSHVRNMIVSRTYMGEHLFGRRSANRNRKVIARSVPAIVTEQSLAKRRSEVLQRQSVRA